MSWNGKNIEIDNSVAGRGKILAIACNSIQATKILPDDYTQVDYIQSSGTQYIDTGIIPNQDTGVYIDFSLVATNSSWILGARGSNYNDRAFALFIPNSPSNTLRTDYNATNTNITISQNRNIVFKNKNNTYLNNTLVTSATYASFTSPFNLYLFNINNNAVSDVGAHINLYRCKIYSNGTLVRDFIPCYRNSDNVIGLYDTLNNVFYTNVGTGTFTKSSNSILPNLDFPISIKSSGDEGKINVTSSDGTNTTNYTVTLPTGTVGGKLLNGVQDTIDSTGLFTKKVGKIILNGTESWIFADSTTTTARFQCATTRNLIKLYPNNDSNCLLSDKFKTDITVNGYTEVIATHNYYGIQMMILKSRLTGWSDSLTSTQKVTLLQTYLASNNVTVYYELATPVTTQLTLPKLNIFDNITYITTQNAVQADLTVDLFTWLGQIFKYTDFNDFLDRLNVIVQSKIGSALTYQGNAINTLYKANGNFLFCEDVETLESTIAYMCDRCGQEFNKTDWGNLSTLSHKDLDKFEQGLSRIMQGQYVEKILYPADDLYPSNKLFMK